MFIEFLNEVINFRVWSITGIQNEVLLDIFHYNIYISTFVQNFDAFIHKSFQ